MAEDVKAEETESPKKKKAKRWPIVLGIVVVVLVAAGAGFWAWHNTPGFCAAICHTPMDAYLDTYNGTQDKYGNDMDETSACGMMSYVHEQEGLGCLDCHVPTLSEQVNEGIEWVSGNYTILGANSKGQNILETRDLDALVAARGLDSGEEFCLNSGCHTNEDGSVMTRDDLIELTSDYERNPHLEQHGSVACSQCHKAHTQSVNYCSSCHSDAPIPDGWLTVAEADSLWVLPTA